MKTVKELVDISEAVKTHYFGSTSTDNWIDEATTVLCHQERLLEAKEQEVLKAFDSGRLFERTQEKNMTDKQILKIAGGLAYFNKQLIIDFARAILRKAQEK